MGNMIQTAKFSVETIYRIHDGENGVFLCVGPDRESGTWVEIYTVGEKNDDYFGEIRLVLSPEMARKVAQVLHAAAGNIEGKE